MKRLTWLFLIVALTLPVQAGVPEPKGVWEFNAPDPGMATIGAPLELVGSAQEITGLDAGDGAIRIGEGSYYVCTHGIAPNGDGAKVNEWTLLIDFSYPSSSLSDPPNGYSDLFQTDPTNASDSDWTINSSGGIGIGAVGYTSAHGYTTEANTWYRLVVVVDNGVRHDVYVDGVEIFQGNEQGIDGRFSLAETLLLFCAGNNQDGDDAPIDVSTVAIWDTPFSADEVSTFGGAGDRFFTQKLASNPTPADGSDDVLISTDLAWAPGEYAATHNVYFDPSWEDVNTAAPTALIAEGLALDVNSLDIGRLDFGQTYYWRVDEVNGAPDYDVIKGKVWSFTAEPFAYAIQTVVATSNGTSDPGAGPENTVNGSGLNASDEHSVASADMWLASPQADPLWIQYEFDRVYKLHEMLVWNYNVQFELVLGFGLKDVTVEYSENGADWMVLGDEVFAQATANASYTANTTVDFGGAAVKYVRLTINGGWGVIGKYGLGEVRFLYVPVQPREPQPADGATGISPDAVFTWRAGREAVAHDVYLSTDQQAVAEGAALVDSVSTNDFAPGDLELGTTYYWKINEVNEAEVVSVWEGDLWSFATQEYFIVDDFESYDNEENLIYETWLDGWVNETGSTVGYLEAPFAETTIVNSGGQAMPLFYDNTGVATSEADLELSQNWTTNGVKSLSLYFHGDSENSGGQLYVKINNTKVAYDGDAADITLAAWQPWNIDLSTVGNVSNVSKLTIGVEGAGASGVVYIDDIRLYPQTPEYIVPTEPDSTGLVALYTLDGNANDSSGNGNNGTLNGDVQFGAGVDGSALDCDGVDDFVSTGKSASDLGIGGNSPRTVTVWVYTRSFANGGIYDVGARTTGQDFCLRTMATQDTWRIQYWGGDFDFTYDTANKWVHFAHVHDGTNTKIYANGVLIVDWAKTIDTPDTNPFQIGLYGWPGNYFDGLIDDLHLYNRALSAEEVLGAAGQTVPRHKPF